MTFRNILPVFFFLLASFGCRKDISDKATTISGRLVESSSNAIPVIGYKLTLVQNRILTPFGSHEGIEQTITTDAEGRFSFSYSLKRGTGVAANSTNPNPLYIIGNDTMLFKSLYPEFNPISVSMDTNLNTIYLYKKIDQLVRKVRFDLPLPAGESLDVITPGATQTRTLSGPIAAGTLIVVDTLINYKLSRLDLGSKKYTILSVLKKPGYQKDLNIQVDVIDEKIREILMVY
jgi:hypothetical protein